MAFKSQQFIDLSVGLTYGELRKILEKEKATWTTDKEAPDDQEIPEYSTGASGEGLLFNGEVEKVDLKSILADPPNNPFLLIRRIDEGFIKPDFEKPSKVINPQTSEVIDMEKHTRSPSTD